MIDFFKKHLGKLIAFGVSLILVFLFMILKGIFNLNEYRDIMIAVIDSFFSIGILYVCFGLLIFVSNDGIFNIFVYGIKQAVNILRFDKEKQRMKISYHDYCMGRNRLKFGYLIIIGVILCLISFLIYFFI